VSDDPQQRRSVPFGTIVLLAIVGALYLLMLGSISFSSGGGDASFGRAIASLFFTVGLWVALAVLLIVSGVMGEMPRWAAIIAVILLPLAGIATFTAIDMCSRHIKWAVVFPVILPLLVAAYAVWARLPKFRTAIPAEVMSTAVWASVLALSLAALLAASII
jgi:hypothetical protein